MSQRYFALASDGRVYDLGMQEDWETADGVATKAGHYPVWVFDENDAHQWLATITSGLALAHNERRNEHE